MTVYIVVVRATNEYVAVFSSLEAIPAQMRDEHGYYRIIRRDI